MLAEETPEWAPEPEITDPELLREIYAAIDEIEALFAAPSVVHSLDEEIPGTGLTWEESLPDPAAARPFEQFLLREQVAALLKDLPADQRELLRRLYWLEQAVTDAAAAMGLGTLEFELLHGRALCRMRFLWK